MQLQLEGDRDTRTRLSPPAHLADEFRETDCKESLFFMSHLGRYRHRNPSKQNPVSFIPWHRTGDLLFCNWMEKGLRKRQKRAALLRPGRFKPRPYYTNNSVLLGLLVSPLCINILLPCLRLYNLFPTELKVHTEPLYVVCGMGNRE